MVNFISVEELRPKLSGIIKQVHDKLDRYIITKRGRPEAVMLSLEDYESLVETLDIEADKKLLKRLKKAEKDLHAGKGTSLEKIHGELGFV